MVANRTIKTSMHSEERYSCFLAARIICGGGKIKLTQLLPGLQYVQDTGDLWWNVYVPSYIGDDSASGVSVT